MNEFAFAANEYVAACGDQNKVYKFICDALAGKLYYWKKADTKWVWDGFLQGHYETIDTDWTVNDGVVNGTPNGSVGDADYIGNYSPCGAEHEASVYDDFFDGFVDYNKNGNYDEGEGVIVWRGPNGNNGHATQNLDMNTWETTKS